MRVFNLTSNPIRLRFYVIIAISTLTAIVLATSANTVRADGITWATQTSAADNNWISVTWGGPTGQQKFVAVASTGTGNRVMTSPDGITWTTQTSTTDNEWTQVAWGGPTGQQKFVAVASTGTGDRVMTSPDGITWTTQTSAADNNWRSVVWGGPTGQQKFVAVANSGTGNRVMTSGLSASAPSAPTINSITSGDSSLTVSFTAAADGGSPITNYKYSTDGVTYSALNPASTSSQFTISGLTNGTTYSVTIKSVNTIGDSVASNAIGGTPGAATTTTTPTTTTLAPEVALAGKVDSLPETGNNSSTLAIFGLLLTITGFALANRSRIIQ